MREKYFLKIILILFFISLGFLVVKGALADNEMLSRMESSLNQKDFLTYLKAFSPHIRNKEKEMIKSRFAVFQPEQVKFINVKGIVQTDSREEIWLQVIYENEYSLNIESWKLYMFKEEGKVQIKSKEISSNIDTLYKIQIPSGRFERVQSVEINYIDIKITFKNAVVFYDNIPGLETALVIWGKGDFVFSPSDNIEKHQLELLYEKPFLMDELEYIYLRFPDSFFKENIKIIREEENSSSEMGIDLSEVQSIFEQYYPLSFSCKSSISKNSLSFLPTNDEVVFDFKGKNIGNYTYVYSSVGKGEVNLYRWKDKKIICIYSPQRNKKKKLLFVSFLKAFDVESYDVDIQFQPKKNYISGKAKIDLKTKIDSLDVLKFKFNPQLSIIKINDDKGHNLFYSVDELRKNLYLYPFFPLPENSRFSIEIYYRGRILPPKQIADVLSVAQYRDNSLNQRLLKTYLYSKSSYWYPAPPEDDYFIAQLSMTIPSGYSCISNGTLISEKKLESSHQTNFTFKTKYPLKYMTFIVGKFKEVETREMPIPLKIMDSMDMIFKDSLLLNDSEKIINFYENRFGTFPFEKLTIVRRFWLTSGGHSPSSFIVLNEKFDSNVRRRFTNVNSPVDLSKWREYFLAHEIAHQWWGQGVTWETYKDQWLSEGLAQFAVFLYLREEYGEKANSYMLNKFSKWTKKYSEWGPIILGSRLSFFDFKAYQSIIYDKSVLVLNMLFDIIGEETFFRAIKEFFNTYKYKAANTDDFIRVFQKISGKNMENFFSNWFYSHVLPEVNIRYSIRKQKKEYVFQFNVNQIKSDFVFPLWIRWKENGKTVNRKFVVDEKYKEFRIRLTNIPKKIEFNPSNQVPGEFIIERL